MRIAGALAADTGLTIADVREKLLEGRGAPRVRPVYQRAHDRGEIDLAAVPEAVLELPFDLVRHDMLMDLEPLGAERVHSVVDDLFLPLVTQSRAG